WRLVDIEEAAQVHAMGAQIADVEHRILVGLELNSQAALDSIGHFMVLGEAHDCSGRQEPQSSRIAGVGILPVDQAVEGILKGGGKESRITEQLAGGVQVIFARAEL